MLKNRTWLVFANESKCNHIGSFKELRFINWVENKTKFAKGDTVYVFVSSSTERRIRYKTKVVAIHSQREDSAFWIGEAPNDITSKLQLVKEFEGNELNESFLVSHGFNGGRSIQRPMCNNPELFEYIEGLFNSK